MNKFALAIALLRSTIESLDRICPACMAATSDESAAKLHDGKPCDLYPIRRTAPASRDR